MSRSSAYRQDDLAGIDLGHIAERILKLAEIAVLEHLDAVDRSQAVGLSEMCRRLDENHHGAERCGSWE